MKNRRMKGTALVLCLLLLSTAGAFGVGAEGESGLTPDSITNTSVGMERVASLKAESEATCHCNILADWIMAEYQMEKLDGNVYRSYGNPVSIYQYDTSVFADDRRWTVGSGGTYRLKVYFYEHKDGITKFKGPYYSQSVGL
ncbi:MAG: hypothetical protein Q4C22_08245 [Bacillota bacterium]|nr:hypothetical protein [Bacillota bacterium]